MDDVEIRSGYAPGAIGRVVELHAGYYHAHWGLGPFFEAKVASELAEFIGRYDSGRDGIWTASIAGRIEGSITIDGLHAAEDGAHLRYRAIYLWTFDGLQAARHLYEKAGFVLVEQRRGSQWGSELTEQRFELRP